MIGNLKKVYYRIKNLGFYLAMISFLVTGTVVVDAVYEMVHYDYKQKIPTIAFALILLVALAA